MKLTRQATRLANNFREMPRSESDLEAANVLTELARVYEAAYDMMTAKTHEQSKAAYNEMLKLIKNEPNNT
jgi:hypothetical protein